VTLRESILWRRTTMERTIPLRNGSFTDGGKATAHDFSPSAGEKRPVGRAYLFLSLPADESRFESTFFKYPPGTCSRENTAGIFIATVGRHGANLSALIERTPLALYREFFGFCRAICLYRKSRVKSLSSICPRGD